MMNQVKWELNRESSVEVGVNRVFYINLYERGSESSVFLLWFGITVGRVINRLSNGLTETV